VKGGSLKSRIIMLGVGAAILPVIIITWLTIHKNLSLRAEVGKELGQQAHDILAGAATSVYELCQTQEDAGSHIMQSSLRVAKDVLARHGAMSFLPEAVEWQAVNQFTQAASTVSLPKMAVGGVWWGQVRQEQSHVPVVDDTAKLVGGTCTIFQRMNPQGDMLRIATNVLKDDRTRAIGTFIPAVNPDGKPNPVIAAISRGVPYTGRAFVVKDWYSTAYEPVQDASGNIIGMIYVGIKQSEMPGAQSLREAIVHKKIGKSGYVFVLEGSGAKKGQYVITQDGQRSGESVWDQKDASGKPVIQDMITAAMQKSGKEVSFQDYLWQNPGEPQPRVRMAAVTYFKPWDWVIGVSVFKDELGGAQQRIEESYRTMIWRLIGIGVIMVILVGGVSIVWGVSLSRPINRTISHLKEISDDVASASGQVSAASLQLSQGASMQAGSLENTSASMEEMASRTRQNAEHATAADNLMGEAGRIIDQAEGSLQSLTQAMAEVTQASSETAKIVRTIDEISFQTNLLALNAAVEAARAGEAGAGFAVVAGEVRNLAQRAAEAAKNTADLIDATVTKIKGGAELVSQTATIFTQVAASTSKAKDLVGEIAGASREQAQGVEQINAAIFEIDKVVQENAARAEESANSSQVLQTSSDQMQGLVAELMTLVSSANGGQKQPEGSRPRRSPGALIPRRLTSGKPTDAPPAKPTPQIVSSTEVLPLSDQDVEHF